jgi:hypothetical protein
MVGETPSFVLSDGIWNSLAMTRELSVFSMPCQSQSRGIPRRCGKLTGHSAPNGAGASTNYD